MSEEEKAALAMDWLKEAQKVSRETGKDYWLCLVTIVERESFEAAAKECEKQSAEDEAKYRAATVTWAETKYLSRSCGADDCAKSIRALAKGR